MQVYDHLPRLPSCRAHPISSGAVRSPAHHCFGCLLFCCWRTRKLSSGTFILMTPGSALLPFCWQAQCRSIGIQRGHGQLSPRCTRLGMLPGACGASRFSPVSPAGYAAVLWRFATAFLVPHYSLPWQPGSGFYRLVGLFSRCFKVRRAFSTFPLRAFAAFVPGLFAVQTHDQTLPSGFAGHGSTVRDCSACF